MVDKEEPKLHPVIELMIARMESHPEEFTSVGRWNKIIEGITKRAVGADKKAFEAVVSKLWLGRLHEQALDELLNGEERRQKEKAEKQELERQAMNIQQAALAQQYGQIHTLSGMNIRKDWGYENSTYTALSDPVDAIGNNPNMLDRLRKALSK